MQKTTLPTMHSNYGRKKAVLHPGYAVSETLFIYNNGGTWTTCDIATGLSVYTANTRKACIDHAAESSRVLTEYIKKSFDKYMDAVIEFAELDRITESEFQEVT